MVCGPWGVNTPSPEAPLARPSGLEKATFFVALALLVVVALQSAGLVFLTVQVRQLNADSESWNSWARFWSPRQMAIERLLDASKPATPPEGRQQQ